MVDIVSSSSQRYTDRCNFQEYEINQENEEDCSICLTSLKTEQFIYKTICDHLFHKICLYNWLTSNSSNLACPICRTNLVGNISISRENNNSNNIEEEPQEEESHNFRIWQNRFLYDYTIEYFDYTLNDPSYTRSERDALRSLANRTQQFVSFSSRPYSR